MAGDQEDWIENTVGTRDHLLSLPQGFLGKDQTTATVRGGPTVIVPLQVGPFYILDSREIEVSFIGRVSVDSGYSATQEIIGILTANGSTQLDQIIKYEPALPTTGEIKVISATSVHTPGASGFYTYEFQFWNSAGSAPINLLDAAGAHAKLWVKDVGTTL